MNQICILRSLHFSCLICRISSDGGGFGGRRWHDSRNEQDVSLPYRAVQISIVLARARVGASWEVRDGMPEMADKAECAFTPGVTRDKLNCGHPRYKSVNEFQI